MMTQSSLFPHFFVLKSLHSAFGSFFFFFFLHFSFPLNLHPFTFSQFLESSPLNKSHFVLHFLFFHMQIPSPFESQFVLLKDLHLISPSTKVEEFTTTSMTHALKVTGRIESFIMNDSV